MSSSVCACACGATKFGTTADPLFRIICHCSICRRFNDTAYADVVVYRAAHVKRPAPDAVDFRAYRPPPNVQRGKCVRCSQPAIEVFKSFLLPDLIMIPRRMFATREKLPPPRAHIFYESRIDDLADDLPRHEGYWRSQLAFSRYLLASMSGRAGR